MALWGDVGPKINWECNDLQVGCHADVVIDLFSKDDSVYIGRIWPCSRAVRIVGLGHLNSSTVRVSLFQAMVRDLQGIITLVIDDRTHVLPLAFPCKGDFANMVELCSGIGVGTFGFEAVGMTAVAAIDHSQPFCDLYKALHPTTKVICGDIGNSQIIAELFDACPNAATLMSGFSCQPFSSGGQQQGAGDDRSQALPATLKVAKALQCRIIILECVPAASTNRFVRQVLDDFCRVCRYQCSEIILRLDSTWCSKRDRWWAVLSDCFLGQVPLKALPLDSFPRHVLPEPIPRPLSELQELILDAAEMRVFIRHTQNLRSLFLDRNKVGPTALHSWGSQATACPCGCREAGFSDLTLSSKGIYGFVIPTHREVELDGVMWPELRHPHPLEVAALTAVPMPTEFQGPLRLWVAGLGQQASPIHTVWIGAQVAQFIDRVHLGTSKVQPGSQLELFRQQMMLWCKQLFPVEPPSSVADFDLPVVASPLVYPPWYGLSHQGGVSVVSLFDPSGVMSCVAVPPACKVQDLLTAEGALRQTSNLLLRDCLSGDVLTSDMIVNGLAIWIEEHNVLPPEGSHATTSHAEPVASEVSPTIPFEIVQVPVTPMVAGTLLDEHTSVPDPWNDVHMAMPDQLPSVGREPLLALKGQQFLTLHSPRLHTLHDWIALGNQEITSKDRLRVLKKQDQLWADDEIYWHVQASLCRTHRSTWEFVDPVLLRAFLDSPTSLLLAQWYRGLPSPPQILLGIVAVSSHWAPFVWALSGRTLHVHSWDVRDSPAQDLDSLHWAICALVGAETFVVTCQERTFAFTSGCGVCSVRFLEHWIAGCPLPTEDEDVKYLTRIGREKFAADIVKRHHVSRPWIWGSGLEPRALARLEDLLRQHGVPNDLVGARVHLACQAMGLAAVQKAVTGSAPWRALKSLANQTRPVFQLVLKTELNQALEAKTEQTGHRPKPKAKAVAKANANPAKPAKPTALDPAKLCLDNHSFVTGKGVPWLANMSRHTPWVWSF